MQTPFVMVALKKKEHHIPKKVFVHAHSLEIYYKPNVEDKGKLKFVPPTIINGVKYAVSKEAHIKKNSKEWNSAFFRICDGRQARFSRLDRNLASCLAASRWYGAFDSLQRVFHNKVPVGGRERPGPKLGPLVCRW